MKFCDITNQRFGKLIAKEVDLMHLGRLTKWVCVCDCGKSSSAYLSNLKSGKSKSCGCGKGRHTHGMNGTKIYKVWWAMIQRCRNQSDPHYDRYGGRGIAVSESWKSFSGFFADMGLPDKGMTLERKDNDRGYSVDNCKWATRKEQTRNRHNTVIYTSKGKTMTLNEWSANLGMTRECIRGRIRRGWSVDSALAVMTREAAYQYGKTKGTDK